MDWITSLMAAAAIAVLAVPMVASKVRVNEPDILSDLKVVRRVGQAMAAQGCVEGVKAANALIEAALSIPLPVVPDDKVTT